MRKKLVYIFFLCAFFLNGLGVYFLVQPLESWNKTEYKRDYYTAPNGEVHDETRPTQVTFTSANAILGIGICILGSSLFLAAIILLSPSLNNRE